MTRHHSLTDAQQRLYDTVICAAAMGDRTIREILRALVGVEPAGNLAAVEAALREDARALARRR